MNKILRLIWLKRNQVEKIPHWRYYLLSPIYFIFVSARSLWPLRTLMTIECAIFWVSFCTEAINYHDSPLTGRQTHLKLRLWSIAFKTSCDRAVFFYLFIFLNNCAASDIYNENTNLRLTTVKEQRSVDSINIDCGVDEVSTLPYDVVYPTIYRAARELSCCAFFRCLPLPLPRQPRLLLPRHRTKLHVSVSKSMRSRVDRARWGGIRLSMREEYRAYYVDEQEDEIKNNSPFKKTTLNLN